MALVPLPVLAPFVMYDLASRSWIPRVPTAAQSFIMCSDARALGVPHLHTLFMGPSSFDGDRLGCLAMHALYKFFAHN